MHSIFNEITEHLESFTGLLCQLLKFSKAYFEPTCIINFGLKLEQKLIKYAALNEILYVCVTNDIRSHVFCTHATSSDDK